MVDISDIMNYLPTAGNNRSIAVGFENIDALAPLKIILDDYLNKTSKEFDKLKENENNIHKEEVKKWDKILPDILNNQNKTLKQLKDDAAQREKDTKELLAEQQKTRDSLKEKSEDNSAREKIFLRALSAAIKIADKHIENAVNFGNVMIDLETNGVFLKNGFDELGQAAHTLGMTHEDLANHLKKTSPLISKLNGSMGNGLKSFQSAISNIDNNLNLTNKEKVAIFENVLTNMSPDQLMKMSQEQMNIEINKTAKEMKMLSMATGKSVDLINQENAQRESTQRQQVWKRTHQASFNALKALGLDKDQEMMDYIMSGGTKATANILTRMQNDPFMQKVLPQMIRMANSNKLDIGSLSSLYAQNKHLVGYKSAYANRASFDQGIMGAAATSDYFQNATLNDTFGEAFMKMNLNGDMASQYFSPARADANRALGNMIGAKRAYDALEANKLMALSGGEKGVANVGAAGEFGFGLASKAVNKWNEWFGGTAGGLAASTLDYTGETIFKAAVSRFDNAVKLFSASVWGNMIGGKNIASFLKNPKKMTKVVGKNIVRKGSKAVKTTGKVAGNVAKGGGKLLGKAAPVLAVASAGLDTYDFINESIEKGGMLNAMDDNIKQAHEGSITDNLLGLLNPFKFGASVEGLTHKALDAWFPELKGKYATKTPTNSSITTPTSKTNEEDKQQGTEMLQYMKSTNDKIENMCMLMEENNKISYQTRIDTKTKGEHQN